MKPGRGESMMVSGIVSPSAMGPFNSCLLHSQTIQPCKNLIIVLSTNSFLSEGWELEKSPFSCTAQCLFPCFQRRTQGRHDCAADG